MSALPPHFNAEKSPLAQHPFTVPEGFFAQQEDNIRLQTTEVGALLQRVGQEHPYLVPAGFWDSLLNQIMQRVQAPVARAYRPAWQYASATLAAASLAVGVLYITLPGPDAMTPPTLQAFSDEQIIRYLQERQGVNNSEVLAVLPPAKAVPAPAPNLDDLPALSDDDLLETTDLDVTLNEEL
jgi:hypothetical protein